MEITPLGDSALLIRVAENFDEAPEDALTKVLATKQALQLAKIPGAIEIAPAYATVAVFYNPARAIDAGAPVEDVFGWIGQHVRKALAEIRSNKVEGAFVEIPVCYEAEFALDLEHVAKHAGMHGTEVVDLHRATEYRVHCVGFTPGFPFLGGLSRKLATPRREVPRKEIPAGSVAIGGSQTGIYPIKSPGGWNVIGRTPLRLFDPKQNPPALLRAGDHVRFRSITREEFEARTR